MGKKWYVVATVLLAAAGMNACDEGKYNDTGCDSAFTDECIDYNHYMSCKDGRLVKVQCPPSQFCRTDPIGTSKCVDARSAEGR